MAVEDLARFIYDHLPTALYRSQKTEDAIAWRVSPTPLPLAPATVDKLTVLGADLLLFYQALNKLYAQSVSGHAPAFVADYLDQGKPEYIIKLNRQNCFKQDLPRVIRPDLMLTEEGLMACELDSVPGGMGFVGAMAQTYAQANIDSVGGSDGVTQGFIKMMRAVSKMDAPTVAIVVSDEANDYRSEFMWLAESITQKKEIKVYVCAPKDIILRDTSVFIRLDNQQEQKIDVLYRNFELFDLFNIPKQELMLYAARHRQVCMTPPPKAQLEEKLAFALFHHPRLNNFWCKELSQEVYQRLEKIVPKTWVLDPAPLPPQAVIYGLEREGEVVSDWMQLAELSKRERNFVVKPSGFSEWAWGARGVKIAHDLTQEAWRMTLADALNSYAKNPHILQVFHKAKKIKQSYFNTQHNQLEEFFGRVRLSLYFFVLEHSVELVGILATIAPAEKKIDPWDARCGHDYLLSTR